MQYCLRYMCQVFKCSVWLFPFSSNMALCSIDLHNTPIDCTSTLICTCTCVLYSWTTCKFTMISMHIHGVVDAYIMHRTCTMCIHWECVVSWITVLTVCEHVHLSVVHLPWSFLCILYMYSGLHGCMCIEWRCRLVHTICVSMFAHAYDHFARYVLVFVFDPACQICPSLCGSAGVYSSGGFGWVPHWPCVSGENHQRTCECWTNAFPHSFQTKRCL